MGAGVAGTAGGGGRIGPPRIVVRLSGIRGGGCLDLDHQLRHDELVDADERLRGPVLSRADPFHEDVEVREPASISVTKNRR